jgi:hypothetical protein
MLHEPARKRLSYSHTVREATILRLICCFVPNLRRSEDRRRSLWRCRIGPIRHRRRQIQIRRVLEPGDHLRVLLPTQATWPTGRLPGHHRPGGRLLGPPTRQRRAPDTEELVDLRHRPARCQGQQRPLTEIHRVRTGHTLSHQASVAQSTFSACPLSTSPREDFRDKGFHLSVTQDGATAAGSAATALRQRGRVARSRHGRPRRRAARCRVRERECHPLRPTGRRQ